MRSARPSREWWKSSIHDQRRPWLKARAALKSAIRAHLEAEGFIEVEPACLQPSPGNETHLNAFATNLIGTDLATTRMYLHTSPEFAMKKLVAAGETKIFAFAPVFRNRERGPLHAPEFTMLEWYRAGADYDQLWADCAAFLRLAAQTCGQRSWTYRDRTCDPLAPLQTLSVAEAFAQHANIDIMPTFTATTTDRDQLDECAQAAGISTASDDTWSDIFSRIIVEKVEPALGHPVPTILHSYPIHEAALARRCPDQHAFAERFELYCCGVELANGFGELTDPDEQRRRFKAQMDERQRTYGERYPLDEELLAALPNMPPTGGCALGFDRLVMLATGATSVADVQWTPLSE